MPRGAIVRYSTRVLFLMRGAMHRGITRGEHPLATSPFKLLFALQLHMSLHISLDPLHTRNKGGYARFSQAADYSGVLLDMFIMTWRQSDGAPWSRAKAKVANALVRGHIHMSSHECPHAHMKKCHGQ